MPNVDELLRAIQDELDNRHAGTESLILESQNAVTGLLDGLEAAADAQSAEHPSSHDRDAATLRKPIESMFWHEHLAELLRADNVPVGHLPRLREIARRGTPVKGDSQYLADLVRFVRGDTNTAPCMIGAGKPGQLWGLSTAVW